MHQKMMNTFVDTVDDTDVMETQAELTPEERDYWAKSIEEDLAEIASGKPQRYITLDEFEKKMIAAVHKIYA